MVDWQKNIEDLFIRLAARLISLLPDPNPALSTTARLAVSIQGSTPLNC